MLKSTLLDIIRTFSKEELNKFEDFIRSPYFNKKDHIADLFSEIKKFFPDFNNEDLKRELVWNKLFPGKEFNYGIMKNVIHELSKLCEKFITLEYYFKNELRMFQDLTDELDNRNLTKILSTKLLSIEKNFSIEKAINSGNSIQDYYYVLSKVHWLKLYYDYQDNLNYGFERERSIPSEFVIYSFMIYLFKVYDNLRVFKYNEVNNAGPDIVDLLFELFDNGGMKKILDYAKTRSEDNFKILNCYYAMYKAVSDVDNADNYSNFKLSLLEITDLITENDFRYLCINLINSATNQSTYFFNREKELQDVFNIMISNNIFTESNGTLKENLFINYIISRCGIHDPSDLEDFILTFKDKLPEDKRESSYNFGMAHFHFINSEYFKSLESLSKISNVYFDMKYYVKNLQMMNYYELDDYESFVYAFDSYKHFTSKNKKIPEAWKTRISAFYNTTKVLFQLKSNFDEYVFFKLKKEITESFPSRKLWLLRKLDDLFAMSNA